MASNKNRKRDEIITIAQVIVIDTKGNQYPLDPNKIVITDKETDKPLFQEIK